MNNTSQTNSTNHTHDNGAVDTLPMPLAENISDLFAQLAGQDVEQFYQAYQFWTMQRRIDTLQLQIEALQQHIEENAELMQQVRPSAISLAALARLQASGVEDIELLEKMLERGEMWLDQTIQLLDQCERLDLIHDNYTEWCEHALEGAYNWLQSIREAGATPKIPSAEKATATEQPSAEATVTETELLQKLMSDEDEEVDEDKTIQLPVVARSSAVDQAEDASPQAALDQTTAEVGDDEEIIAPLVITTESEAGKDEEQAPSVEETEVAEEAAIASDTDEEAQPELVAVTTAVPTEAASSAEDISSGVEAPEPASDARQESEASASYIDTEESEASTIAPSVFALTEQDEQDVVSDSMEQETFSEEENPNIEMPAIRITAPLAPIETSKRITAPLAPIEASDEASTPEAEQAVMVLPQSEAPPVEAVASDTSEALDEGTHEGASAATTADEPVAEASTAVEVSGEPVGEPEDSEGVVEPASTTEPKVETAAPADETIEHIGETSLEVASVETADAVIPAEGPATEPDHAEDEISEADEADTSKDEISDYEQVTLTNLRAIKPPQVEDAVTESSEAEAASPVSEQIPPDIEETTPEDASDLTATSQEATNDTRDISDIPTATREEAEIIAGLSSLEPTTVAEPTNHTDDASEPQPVAAEEATPAPAQKQRGEEIVAAAQTAPSLPKYQFSPISSPGTEEESPYVDASWQWKDLTSYEQSLAAAPTAPHPIVQWPAETVEEKQPKKKRGFFRWLWAIISGQE